MSKADRRLHNPGGGIGPRERRQHDELARHLDKSQRPELIKRFNRKFGKRNKKMRPEKFDRRC
jgi:hypothetical protein